MRLCVLAASHRPLCRPQGTFAPILQHRPGPLFSPPCLLFSCQKPSLPSIHRTRFLFHSVAFRSAPRSPHSNHQHLPNSMAKRDDASTGAALPTTSPASPYVASHHPVWSTTASPKRRTSGEVAAATTHAKVARSPSLRSLSRAPSVMSPGGGGSAAVKESPTWSPRESTYSLPTNRNFHNKLPPLDEMDLFVSQSADNLLSLLPDMTESIQQLLVHYPEIYLGVWEKLRLILEEAE